MSKKLFVGNLPFSYGKTDLETLFAAYGDLEEVVIITNKYSGRSKGFGFVTIKDDAQAEKAVQEVNGKDINGRAVTVNEAKPFDPDAKRPERRSFGGDRGGGYGGRGGGRGGFGGGRSGGFGGSRGRDRDSDY